MAIKVDLEKAYDRLSWSFIRDTLVWDNLLAKLIDIIMDMVSLISMKALWNGVPSDEFLQSRGIRQGDPLSSYLFVL